MGELDDSNGGGMRGKGGKMRERSFARFAPKSTRRSGRYTFNGNGAQPRLAATKSKSNQNQSKIKVNRKSKRAGGTLALERQLQGHGQERGCATRTRLGGDAEFAGFFHVAVGHARSIERRSGAALTIEEDQSAGGVHAMRELAHAGVRDGLRERKRAGLLAMREQNALIVQKIGGHFGHHNFHNAFAVAGAGDSAGFRVGVAAAADERRIADAAGKFAAGAAGGSSGEKMSVLVERHSADGAGFVAQMMFGGVRIAEAAAPGDAFAFVDQVFGRAEREAVFLGEFFRAGSDEHHVLAVFEHAAREADGIVDVFYGGDGARFQRRAVHEDRVELDLAVGIKMRAEARVESGIVFQNYDAGFDGVNRGAAGRENFPSGFERALHAGAAVFDGFVGDVPSAAVNDQGRLQRSREMVRKP
jgi:hypothetical protein